MNRCLVFFLLLSFHALSQSKALVFQSDFGVKDGAVSAMKGVAYAVSPDLAMFDLTHEIPAFNIWEAAYRLNQASPYWPPGTVFVSVVDPGVGSARRSVVMKTKTGHYFVTPDNGTLTLVADAMGMEQVRVIDEAVNRRKGSEDSYTFHGRDVYAYTGARLASGVISFEQVGSTIVPEIVRLNFRKAELRDNRITGTIDILDVQYGNVWTNIDRGLLDKLGLKYGENVTVKILNKSKVVYEGKMSFGETFSQVSNGMPIAYLNSLLKFSVGLNQASFAEKFKVRSGPDWSIEIYK